MAQSQPPKEPDDLQVDTSGAEPAGGDPSEIDRAALVRLLRVAYPHPDFPDGPYERTADAVIAAVAQTPGDQRALTLGLSGLAAAAGGDFTGLDDAAAETLLRDRADDHFFRLVRSTAVVALYDDHEVWGLVGYEGSSVEHGGYLYRGFDDLDWLADPRVKEYDGEPRVELVQDGADR